MAVAMQTMVLYMIISINNKSLPFSHPITKSGGDGTSVAFGILALILIALMVLFHWLIFSYTWAMWTAGAIAIIIIWQLQKKITNTIWKKINFAK
jgi:hypothetical protein